MFTIENEKYQLAQKISGVGIWLWNLKDNSLIWDQRLYEIYGVAPTLVGVTYQMWANLVNPEDLREIELSASRVVEGLSERFDHVFRAQKQDGTPLWIRTIANLYRDQDGHPHEILGANFDVTMEVFYRKALEDEKARLELALEAADLGIWDWDLADKTMHWDPIMVKIWGRRPGVFASNGLQIDLNDWVGIHPEDKTRFQDCLRSTLKSHGTHDLKLRIVMPDQSIRFIGMKMRASRDNARNSIRILGVCQDLTAQTQKDLEGEQQRNLTVQQARLASIGQLAGGVGHEINNPLAIILGFTQKMLRKKESLGLNEELMSGLMKIQDASNRIKKIIDGLRALARPAGEDLVEVSNLKEVVETVISLISNLLIQHGVHIGYKDPGYACAIKVDRSKIQQVFMNLLTNASDAMAEKGQNKIIEVEIEDRGQNWCLKVKDTGAGITDDAKSKVFQSFYTTKGVGVGTGLGLAVSKAMAESWGGDLYFESQLGQGSQFFLEIPKADEAPIKTASQEVKTKIRVVLVTNDSEQQQYLQEYFNKFEFHVKVLSCYTKALEFLSSPSEIDLVLVDSEIQGMDGLNFIAELNQNGYVKTALKIILGSFDRTGMEARTRDFRFGMVDGFIEKPIKEKDLNRLMYRLAHRDPLSS